MNEVRNERNKLTDPLGSRRIASLIARWNGECDNRSKTHCKSFADRGRRCAECPKYYADELQEEYYSEKKPIPEFVKLSELKDVAHRIEFESLTLRLHTGPATCRVVLFSAEEAKALQEHLNKIFENAKD